MPPPKALAPTSTEAVLVLMRQRTAFKVPALLIPPPSASPPLPPALVTLLLLTTQLLKLRVLILSIPPPRWDAKLPMIAQSRTVRVVSLCRPPPKAATPLLMVRPDKITIPDWRLKTRKLGVPTATLRWTASWLAPG